MQRRSFLVWLSRAVYTIGAAVVAAPAARYLGSRPPAFASSSGGPLRRRVARLDSLVVGEPQLLAVTGSRQDGWVRYPDHVVGSIWVTRLGPASEPPGQTKFAVFNAACPHSGCPVQQAAKDGYACHCHGAKFRDDGSRVTGPNYTNPSPRGMDALEHSLVKDDATGEWWLEIVYQDFETGIAERVEKA